MNKRLITIVVSGFCLFDPAGSVFGQTREGQQLVAAELITDATNTQQPFSVGIRFAIQPEWYLYWKNPGDAGLPIEVRWDLPEGWRAGEVQFPVPSKFVHDEITAYGYKKEIVVLATIFPDRASKGPLKAQLDWLVCRESCLRGGTSVSLDVETESPQNRRQAMKLLEFFRSRLPGTQKESGLFFQEAQLSRNGEEWVLRIPIVGGNADKVKDFYPEILEGVVVDFKRITIHQKELRIAFTRQDNTIRTLRLRGLLVTADSAFEIEIPIHLSSQ